MRGEIVEYERTTSRQLLFGVVRLPTWSYRICAQTSRRVLGDGNFIHFMMPRILKSCYDGMTSDTSKQRAGSEHVLPDNILTSKTTSIQESTTMAALETKPGDMMLPGCKVDFTIHSKPRNTFWNNTE